MKLIYRVINSDTDWYSKLCHFGINIEAIFANIVGVKVPTVRYTA